MYQRRLHHFPHAIEASRMHAAKGESAHMQGSVAAVAKIAGTQAARTEAAGTGPDAARGRTRCRFCGSGLHPVVDLGLSPPCESFVPPERAAAGEMFYPLDVRICGECRLMQIGEFVPVEAIFDEYAYFSSFSQTWLEHARHHVATMTARHRLGPDSFVVEVASNDGYLLREVVARGIPCLGVEPAANVARTAIARGIPTRIGYFGRALAAELAAEGHVADLVVANNVLAQVPDLNDFVAGFARILKPGGVLTVEVPHLLRLIAEVQFDTIYHEHFSYFSLVTSERIFAAHGLRVFDVDLLPTHGGSLRLHVCHGASLHADTTALDRVRQAEAEAGLDDVAAYADFALRVHRTKRRLLQMLGDLKDEGLRIVGYGAPGKGNTLLNHCGIRTDLVDFTVDRNPYKHGRLLPGTRIPILAPERLDAARPDVVLILPWNLKDEIMQQLDHVRGWGGRFLVPIPEPRLLA
jgi:SAM-dependent methyltransferase